MRAISPECWIRADGPPRAFAFGENAPTPGHGVRRPVFPGARYISDMHHRKPPGNAGIAR